MNEPFISRQEMIKPFITKDIPDELVMRRAMETNGGGVNTTIPMTRRPYPALSKNQLIKDSKIVKEMTYLFDVMGEKDLAVKVFFENKHRLSDPCFWEMLRTMWIANGKKENLPMFRQLFQSKRPFKYFLMTIEEETVFKALPDTVTAYRAPASKNDIGISWTLSREFVDRYAKHTGRDVVEKQLPKASITAYFNRHGEQEVIVL